MAYSYLLVASRDQSFQNTLRKMLLKADLRIRSARSLQDLTELTERHHFACVFFDRTMSKEVLKTFSFTGPSYLVMVCNPTELGQVLNFHSKEQIHDWLVTPLDMVVAVSVVSRARLFSRQAFELSSIKDAATSAIRADATLLCTGEWAAHANEWIDQMKSSDLPTVFAGEAGCGKRLLARLLHYSSDRASSPFILVRCQSEDSEALEKEIFGEVGSRHRSCFSGAADGSVFFDKVEYLPKRLQQRLAKVLNSSRFSPLGSGDSILIRSRLMFSVQQNTEGVPLSSILQKDLAQVLRRNVLRIPPLRERKKDFPLIVKNAFDKICRDYGARPTGITDGALDFLKSQTWPGNIRELEGLLWAASVVAGKSNISSKVLAAFNPSNGNGSVADEEQAIEDIVSDRLTHLFNRFDVGHLKDLHPMILHRVEKTLIKLVLQKMNGSQVRAARILGINRNTLRRKLSDLKIELSV